MTAQSSHASVCRNSFGSGAKINVVVGTTSKKNGDKRSETAAIILGLNDDDDDTEPFCYIFFTFNILEEDLEITNGNLAFSYNEEDYSIDVSSCVHIGDINVTNIIQNTALKVITVKFDADTSMPFNYSSPNELMFSLPYPPMLRKKLLLIGLLIVGCEERQ